MILSLYSNVVNSVYFNGNKEVQAYLENLQNFIFCVSFNFVWMKFVYHI